MAGAPNAIVAVGNDPKRNRPPIPPAIASSSACASPRRAKTASAWATSASADSVGRMPRGVRSNRTTPRVAGQGGHLLGDRRGREAHGLRRRREAAAARHLREHRQTPEVQESGGRQAPHDACDWWHRRSNDPTPGREVIRPRPVGSVGEVTGGALVDPDERGTRARCSLPFRRKQGVRGACLAPRPSPGCGVSLALHRRARVRSHPDRRRGRALRPGPRGLRSSSTTSGRPSPPTSWSARSSATEGARTPSRPTCLTRSSLGEPGEHRDDRSAEHGADRGRRQVALGQGVGQPARRLQRLALEHPGGAQHDDEQRDPGEVQRERDRPQPADGAPRGVSGQHGGHRDQEVLGEQLRSADGQEDEADPEGQRAKHVRGGLGITATGAPVVTTRASRPSVM